MNIPVGSDVEIGINSAKKYFFVEAIMVSNVTNLLLEI